MANDEIRAKCEEFDEIFSKFSKEIGLFRKDMGLRADEIKTIVNDMGKKWTGNGYPEFSNNMNKQISSIQSSLESCDQLKQKLDIASCKMRIILDRMRAN